MALRCPHTTMCSYVDNLELLSAAPQQSLEALEILQNMTELLGVPTDPNKTYAWSLDAAGRQALRSASQTVRRSQADLGAHMQYSAQQSNGFVKKKCQDLATLWPRLAQSPAPLDHKMKVLTTVAWPRAFHSASTVHLADAIIQDLRAGAMKALRLDKAGANAVLQLSLTTNTLLDPGFYVLWDSLQQFRRFATEEIAQDVLRQSGERFQVFKEVGNDSWMYWESFWAPAEDAALAMDDPAFGDLHGVMLQPTLPASTLLIDAGGSILDQDLPQGAEEERRARAAMKDKAYSIVYEYNVWGSDVSRSGTGSDLWSPEARLAVTALEAVVDAFGIRSMLDCACGDATWMVPFFVTRHPEIQYTGVDVVSEVIQRNQQRHPRINFLAQDLSEMPLPQGAQLIFSKETLNHMHLHDAQRALQQFAQTGARYLLTNVHEGVDNFVGAEKTCHTTYIKYDYELPPFSLPKVVRVNEYQGLETSFTLFQLNPE
eukprot:s1448_g2.t1